MPAVSRNGAKQARSIYVLHSINRAAPLSIVAAAIISYDADRHNLVKKFSANPLCSPWIGRPVYQLGGPLMKWPVHEVDNFTNGAEQRALSAGSGPPKACAFSGATPPRLSLSVSTCVPEPKLPRSFRASILTYAGSAASPKSGSRSCASCGSKSLMPAIRYQHSCLTSWDAAEERVAMFATMPCLHTHPLLLEGLVQP